MPQQDPATFERVSEYDAASPTLVEGLPGHGLVASIAVDQIRKQLDLTHHGNILSDDFPPVVTFENGRVQDLVRVYAGENPDIMTLQSDLVLPPRAYSPLSRCVIDECAAAFERAIFLTGAPAESESRIGDVAGVATDDEMYEQLKAAGVDVAEDPGLVGGITGALVKECYHADVPAIVLVVRSHPFLPDPGAAQQVIEEALEPLVDFDIDTTELREQSDEIQQRMQQIAQQYQQMQQEGEPSDQQAAPSMFQ
jgi:uncharacterized protein